MFELEVTVTSGLNVYSNMDCIENVLLDVQPDKDEAKDILLHKIEDDVPLDADGAQTSHSERGLNPDSVGDQKNVLPQNEGKLDTEKKGPDGLGRDGAGWSRFMFAPTPRMSSYLVCLVIGEYSRSSRQGYRFYLFISPEYYFLSPIPKILCGFFPHVFPKSIPLFSSLFKILFLCICPL